MSRKSLTSAINFDEEPKVLVWGLNDKDQLGGLKGSKVKMPVLSETLSSLHPVHVAGGSKSLFIVSQEGKVRMHFYLEAYRIPCALCHLILVTVYTQVLSDSM